MTAPMCRAAVARACDGVDMQPVKLGLRPTIVPWCAACRTAAAAMGMPVLVVERRVADIPVVTERRRFVPAWMRNLRGRDESGRIHAA